MIPIHPGMPFNNLSLLPGMFDYNQPILLKACIGANEALAKLNGMSLALPNAELLMAPLLTREAVSSSGIENINTTTIKVLQAEAMGEKYIHGAEKEVLYYRQALVFGIEMMRKQQGISTNLLIQMQEILEPNKPGIRKLSGTVIANSRGEILYTPPEGMQLLRDLLTNLEQFLHTDHDIDPLIKVAVSHYQFESIHPFYDGNGRTGRMLMILYLLYTQKLDYPVLFISDYINTHKVRYYELFQHSRKTNDYTDFILYIMDAIREQSIRTQQKITAITKLMHQVAEQIAIHTKLDSHQMTKALFSSPFSSITHLATKTKTTRQTVSKWVRLLEQVAIVQTFQFGKTKLVYVPGFIDIIS